MGDYGLSSIAQIAISSVKIKLLLQAFEDER
jgi:hypothetical protein